MANPFQSVLNWVAKSFQKDASKMLIFTGVAGWALSSLAQMSAILFNPKISKDQKSFLLPQELADAVVNIGAFFLVTQFTKKTVAKMFSTGKFASKEVRAYLNKNPELSKKVGKVDFDLDEVLKNAKDKFPQDSYYTTKNFYTTIATVGAGILSSNIITPLARNAMASVAQKNYLNYKNNNAVIKEEENKPESQKEPTFKANSAYKMNTYYSGNMRI